MHACLCVCMCVYCMYMHHACVHTHVHARKHRWWWTRRRPSRVFRCACTTVSVYTHWYKHTHTCKRARAHTHTHTHPHARPYLHTHVCVCSCICTHTHTRVMHRLCRGRTHALAGTRITQRFNLTHTVGDIYSLVASGEHCVSLPHTSARDIHVNHSLVVPGEVVTRPARTHAISRMYLIMCVLTFESKYVVRRTCRGACASYLREKRVARPFIEGPIRFFPAKTSICSLMALTRLARRSIARRRV